jgi:hypothetical protein
MVYRAVRDHFAKSSNMFRTLLKAKEHREAEGIEHQRLVDASARDRRTSGSFSGRPRFCDLEERCPVE